MKREDHVCDCGADERAGVEHLIGCVEIRAALKTDVCYCQSHEVATDPRNTTPPPTPKQGRPTDGAWEDFCQSVATHVDENDAAQLWQMLAYTKRLESELVERPWLRIGELEDERDKLRAKLEAAERENLGLSMESRVQRERADEAEERLAEAERARDAAEKRAAAEEGPKRHPGHARDCLLNQLKPGAYFDESDCDCGASGKGKK